MPAVETALGSKRRFQSGSLIAVGETFKDTSKSTLKTLDGKNFTIPETDENLLVNYTEIVTAYNAWVATELP